MRAVAALACLGAGCLVDVSFDDTAFRCQQSPECPGGLTCIDGVCRSAPIDAGEGGDAIESADATEESCPAADADGELTALLAPRKPAIDGTLEPLWQGARFVEFANPELSDNTVRVRMLWDAAALYFAFEVTDAQLEAVSEPGAIFRDDGSEIFLDMEHDETETEDADDVHFIANIDGVVQTGTLELAVSTSAAGYVMEHALAWSEAGQTPVAGATLGMLLGGNDRDGGASTQFDWRDLISSGDYSRPNLWGDLHLSEIDAISCPALR